jgi:hypothetical protein
VKLAQVKTRLTIVLVAAVVVVVVVVADQRRWQQRLVVENVVQDVANMAVVSPLDSTHSSVQCA